MKSLAGSAARTMALAALVAGPGCGSSGSSLDGAADGGSATDGRGAEAAASDVSADDVGASDVSADDVGAVDAAHTSDTTGTEAKPPEAGADAMPDAPAGDAAYDGPPPGFSARWVPLGVPSAGNVSALAIATDGTLFAGVSKLSVGTGVFTSRDSGASWQPRNEGIRNFNVQSFGLSQGPIFAATADVVRSIDGGLTWAQSLVSSEPFTLVVADATGSLVFASDQIGGLGLKRSEDGGIHWTPVTNPGAVFTTNSIAVLGSVVLAFGDNGLARSTDAGKTFQSVPGQTGRTSPNQTLPNLLCGNGRCYLAGLSSTRVYDFLLSTDQGATWNPIGQPNYFPLALSSDGTLYIAAGGGLAGAGAPGGVLMRSDDGGAGWVTLPAPPMPPTVLAAKGNDVFAGTSQGILRSQDKGQSWVPANGSVATGALTTNAGLLFVDTSSTAVSPNGDIYVGAPGAGLLRSVDDGVSWSLVKAGFVPGSCVVTEPAGITCFGSGGYLRSMDHGVTWQPGSVPAFAAPLGAVPVLNAVAARGNTVYVSGIVWNLPLPTMTERVARSDDGGLTFQLLTTSPPVDTLQVLGNGHVLGTSISPVQTYRSVDGGATWTMLSNANLLPLSEDASGVLYRGFGQFIQSSTDEGNTWSNVDTHQTFDGYGLRIGPIWFDGAGRMYLVTQPQASLPPLVVPWNYYASDDGSQHLAVFPAPPHPSITMTALDKKRRVLVATNGGVYRLE